MSIDITPIIVLKREIQELNYSIDKLYQEIAGKEKKIKECCTHPTHKVKPVEDEYGVVLSYTCICTLCGEKLQ